MTSTRTGSGTAVLAGSLAAFPLLDVLELLSRTKHAGDVHVVGEGVDSELRIDGGELLTEDPASAPERVFELACHHDAWFTVTATVTATTTATTDAGAEVQRVRIEPITEVVAPRLREWDALVRTIPQSSTVRMAATTPGPEVQIRAEQWAVLSGIGSGRTVRELLDATPGPSVDVLRVIQQLLDERLVVLETNVAPGHGPTSTNGPASAPAPSAIALAGPTPGDAHPVTARPPAADDPGADSAPQGADAAGGGSLDGAEGAEMGEAAAAAEVAEVAEVADLLTRAPIMPPPVAAGPLSDAAAPVLGMRASDQSA